jgi:hypothetical protein
MSRAHYAADRLARGADRRSPAAVRPPAHRPLRRVPFAGFRPLRATPAEYASTPFFDLEDDYHVRVDLWLVANVVSRS